MFSLEDYDQLVPVAQGLEFLEEISYWYVDRTIHVFLRESLFTDRIFLLESPKSVSFT